MNILLVDDSKTMRTIQKAALSRLGDVRFAEAGDGVEALDIISKSPNGFHFMLVDWNMPNMNGLDFVKAFRGTNKATPVIMVTTESEKSRVIEAIKAGVNNYVIKPFTPDLLSQRINETIAKKAA